MGVGTTGWPLLGDLPIMDEEYFVGVPSASGRRVRPQQDDVPCPPIFVAEFEARYGTWVARCARAVRSKMPDARVEVCAVEGDPIAYKQMIAHLERNVPSTRHFVMHGVVANQSGNVVPAMAWQADASGK